MTSRRLYNYFKYLENVNAHHKRDEMIAICRHHSKRIAEVKSNYWEKSISKGQRFYLIGHNFTVADTVVMYRRDYQMQNMSKNSEIARSY